ncbi:hypothetical protein lerEdw1_002465 [Lerista edwardsae]|nr:hypothetical protein lerEdw1_002465 [Lerista edwardsae]
MQGLCGISGGGPEVRALTLSNAVLIRHLLLVCRTTPCGGLSHAESAVAMATLSCAKISFAKTLAATFGRGKDSKSPPMLAVLNAFHEPMGFVSTKDESMGITPNGLALDVQHALVSVGTSPAPPSFAQLCLAREVRWSPSVKELAVHGVLAVEVSGRRLSSGEGPGL